MASDQDQADFAPSDVAGAGPSTLHEVRAKGIALYRANAAA